MQASNSYWAYVLVPYDDNTSSYTYGFTFKDSAGYGLYPTTTEKLNESGSQIQTGLNLNRPTGDSITNITPMENWTGFNLEDDTKLVVLEVTSESETGNGKTTCTLAQKGDNYNQVESDKVNNKITLTIDGNLYNAKRGMTWDDWVSSEYNTLGLTTNPSSSETVYNSSNGYLIGYDESSSNCEFHVRHNEIVNENYNYYVSWHTPACWD